MARDKICTPFLALASPENKFTVNTIEDMQSRKYLKVGDVVELNGYYTAGDGAGHKRKIEETDDGSGVQLANGLWANRQFGVNDLGNKNFIELLKTKPNFKQITKNNEDEYIIQYIYDTKSVILAFNRVANTGYFTQSTTLLADWIYDSKFESGKKYGEQADKTGTWVDSTSSINGYTSQVGATITFDIDILERGVLSTRHQCRDDGGEFEITIFKNSELIKTLIISTYSNTSTKKTFELISSAEIGTYVITYKFIGNGSRGWLTSLAQNLVFSTKNIFSFTNTRYFTTPSNKDFAIEFKPPNATSYQFMPSHSGIQTCFAKSKMLVLIDGQNYIMSPGEKILFNSEVRFIQDINLKHPESSTNSAEANVIVMFDSFGVLSYHGVITLLEDTLFKNGYTMMCIANTENFDNLSTSNGNEVSFSLSDIGGRKNLYDKYFSDSFLFTGDSDMCLAMTVNNPTKTWRVFDETNIRSCYLQIRDKYITKLYTNIFGIPDTPLNKGDKITFSGSYLFIGSYGDKTRATSLM